MAHAARLALACSLASLTACHTLALKVDPALADDRMSVSKPSLFGRSNLVFGQYVADDIDRSWTRSNSNQRGNRTETSSRQTYRFVFAAAGAITDRVRCETVYAETARTYGRLRIDDGRHGLGCTLTDAQGRPSGELVMTEGSRHKPSGRMYHRNIAIDLVPSGRGEGTRFESFDPLGYEMLVDGQMVGAVQTVNSGAVWIDRGAPAELQESAAVAAATLLLYRSIED